MGSLLAVDVGLKTGLALYSDDGRLSWYRSKNYGATSRLKRDVSNILHNVSDIQLLVIEGGGVLAMIWEHEAVRREIPFRQINAEQWRQKLLYPREQMSGLQAKHHAQDRARQIIIWSGLPRPTSLRHDAAEAILIGMWAALEMEWLEKVPHEMRHRQILKLP